MHPSGWFAARTSAPDNSNISDIGARVRLPRQAQGKQIGVCCEAMGKIPNEEIGNKI